MIRDAIHRARRRFARSGLQTADLVQSVFRRCVGSDGARCAIRISASVHDPARATRGSSRSTGLTDDAAHAQVVRRAHADSARRRRLADAAADAPSARSLKNAKRWLRTRRSIPAVPRRASTTGSTWTRRDPMSRHGLVLRASLLDGWSLDRIAASSLHRRARGAWSKAAACTTAARPGSPTWRCSRASRRMTSSHDARPGLRPR